MFIYNWINHGYIYTLGCYTIVRMGDVYLLAKYQFSKMLNKNNQCERVYSM